MLTKFTTSIFMLTLLAFTTKASTNIGDGTHSVSTEKRLREPASDQEIRAIADLAPRKEREGKYKALLDSVERSKNISDQPTDVQVGLYTYRIPMNYLTPYGDFRSSGKRLDNLVFATFLPNFTGYNRENFLDSLHPDKITVTLEADTNDLPEAEVWLDQGIRSKAVESKPSLSQHGLSGYRALNSTSNKVIWIGKDAHGQTLYMECVTTAPVPACNVSYHHRVNHYWLGYRFAYRHFAEWREIDDNVNRLLMAWRLDDRHG